jgi:hypothetical protein
VISRSLHNATLLALSLPRSFHIRNSAGQITSMVTSPPTDAMPSTNLDSGGNCVIPDIAASGCAKGGSSTNNTKIQPAPKPIITDFPCICNNPNVVTSIVSCVPAKCKGAELKTYEAWVNHACKTVPGYPIDMTGFDDIFGGQ